MMTDLYIATSTQAGHDALMRLAESAGYKWHDDALSTVCNLCDYVEEEENVVHLYDDFQEGRRMAQDDKAYYESQDATIETIPNLADIKAIWKVSRENRDAFTMEHRLPPHYKSARKLYVICDEYSGTYTTKENEIYEALAVEYKPQESKAMNKKVKLPRNVIDTFRPELDSPGYRISLIDMRIISDMYNRTLEDVTSDVVTWLHGYDNQWKLIDALRYGYEVEPEPRWGIKAGNCYMDNTIEWQFDRVTPDNIVDDELAYFTNKDEADDMVKTLGFGEVVDLNKESKADE